MADPGGAEGSRADLQLATTFADIARALLAAGTVEETLNKIVELAVATIEGCDHAGVSLIESGRTITSRAASDDVVRAVDRIQHELGEGPCLDAIREHEVFHIDDLSQETRWARFAARAVEETGVRSMLSFRLFAEEHTVGAMNLLAERVGAFDEDAHQIGAVFAAHAAVALVSARQRKHADEAIRTRDVIGQAKGILMARQGLSDEEAFDLLRRASQRMNIKLRDLAERIAQRPLER